MVSEDRHAKASGMPSHTSEARCVSNGMEPMLCQQQLEAGKGECPVVLPDDILMI